MKATSHAFQLAVGLTIALASQGCGMIGTTSATPSASSSGTPKLQSNGLTLSSASTSLNFSASTKPSPTRQSTSDRGAVASA